MTTCDSQPPVCSHSSACAESKKVHLSPLKPWSRCLLCCRAQKLQAPADRLLQGSKAPSSSRPFAAELKSSKLQPTVCRLRLVPLAGRHRLSRKFCRTNRYLAGAPAVRRAADRRSTGRPERAKRALSAGAATG
jgi:hypothetical protein